MSHAICRGEDFYEGIRATILDKDFAPRWSGSSFDEITPDKTWTLTSRRLRANELTFETTRARETVS